MECMHVFNTTRGDQRGPNRSVLGQSMAEHHVYSVDTVNTHRTAEDMFLGRGL